VAADVTLRLSAAADDERFAPASWYKPDGADDFVRPLPVFTCIANMTGQPAASIPAGSTASDLPIGIQIFGRHSPIATYWRSRRVRAGASVAATLAATMTARVRASCAVG
jgi:cytochrome P450